DGLRLASAGDDGLAVIWDTATGAAVHTLKEHGLGVNQVAYRPDGRHLATASWDGTVRVWDTATGERLAVLRGRRLGFLSVASGPRAAPTTRCCCGTPRNTARPGPWGCIPPTSSAWRLAPTGGRWPPPAWTAA